MWHNDAGFFDRIRPWWHALAYYAALIAFLASLVWLFAMGQAAELHG